MQALRVGIGGPVGSGKTALTLNLCRAMRDHYDMAVVTNDIYTHEDAQFLSQHDALDQTRILGVETGGCPHTAIREDASMNLAAIDELQSRHQELELGSRGVGWRQSQCYILPGTVRPHYLCD